VSARLEPTAWDAEDSSKRHGMDVTASTVEFLDRSPRSTDSSEQQPEEAPVAA
jgi:hypothetical protein